MRNDHNLETPNSGLSVIDSVLYNKAPKIAMIHTAPSELIAYRMLRNAPSVEEVVALRPPGPDMLILSNGTGHEVTGKFGGVPFRADPSRVVRATFIPAGVDTEVRFRPSAKSSNIVFPDGFLSDRLDGAQFASKEPFVFCENRSLIRIGQLIEHELYNPGLGSKEYIDHLGYLLALSISRGHTSEAGETVHSKLPEKDAKTVTEFIEENLFESITVSMLANLVGLPGFRFASEFKKRFGISPYKYILKRKLERSVELISDHRNNLADIAYQCGFSSQAHFTVAFRRSFGMPPGQFRKSMSQTSEDLTV